MNITITIPVLKEQTVLDSLGYQAQIEQTVDGMPTIVPNPQTPQQFVKQFLVSQLKGSVSNTLRQREIEKIVISDINIS